MVAAKRLLKGRVNIDSEAGPTEIAVLADDTADPVHVAADLISQAEHDPLAAAVLVTDSAELADGRPGRGGPAGGADQARRTDHDRARRTAVGGRAGRRCRAGVDVVNAYAAEHLEIQTADPERVAARIINAGAIFVGPWSPVSLGDYCAGSTHVLPTGGLRLPLLGAQREELPQGRARDQLLPRGAGARWPGHVEVFAEAEDLPAHGAAVTWCGSTSMIDICRCGRNWSGRCRTAPRNLTFRCALNVNENPYPPSEAVIAEIAAAVAAAARSMNRYPERDALALRADLARYLGHGLTAEQIWAANGSNEVMLHVLQAFAGPGRTRAVLRADVLDVSRVRPQHPQPLDHLPAP